MAQTSAIVRNTLTATGSGTTDFTKASFGTPSAAIIIACAANSTNNPQDSGEISIGFWDGTNQRVIGVRMADNVGDSATVRTSDDTYGMTAPASAASSFYTVSAITDGIRLTLSVDNTTLERYCTVLLLAGISAKTLTFTPNTTQNATTASASLGHAPKLVFFTTVGATAADQNGAANAIMSFGFARDDATHRMLAFGSANASTAEAATIQYSETRCVGQALSGTLSWSGEVTTFGADTFTMTTRDGASGSDVCFALSLGGADLSFDCGTLTTATSTGTQVNATDIAPDALLLMLSTAAGTTIETDSDANGITLGMADDNGEFSHNFYVEDAASTMNTGSVAKAAQCLDLDTSSGGARAEMCDATVALNSADFTLDFTATDATARKGWWVAFGNAAGGATPYWVFARQRTQIIGAGVS